MGSVKPASLHCGPSFADAASRLWRHRAGKSRQAMPERGPKHDKLQGKKRRSQGKERSLRARPDLCGPLVHELIDLRTLLRW